MKTYIVKVDDYGTKRWFLNDKLHREDGPAAELTNGTKCWYLNDKLHREDGPAIEYADGTKYWYLDGTLHREDGPAIELANGSMEWYLNGVEYTKVDWRKQTQKKVKAPQNIFLGVAALLRADHHHLFAAPCVGKIVEVDGVKYKLVEA